MGPEPSFHDAAGKLLGGGNMAPSTWPPYWAARRQGLVAAVAFATILAVVSGLAMAGASAISHDLYAAWWRRGRADANAELRVSRLATVGLPAGAAAVHAVPTAEHRLPDGPGLRHRRLGHFPVLLLALHWPGLSARGALWAGGLAAAAALIVAGPAVWVGVLGHAKPLFPYANPALFSVPLAFALAWLGSAAAQRRYHRLAKLLTDPDPHDHTDSLRQPLVRPQL